MPAKRWETRLEQAEAVTKARILLLAEFHSVRQLANQAFVSRSHLSSLYAGLGKKSIGRSVQEARWQRAYHEILTSDEPISTIALRLGFKSLGSFSRDFRVRFQQSPSSLRKNPQKR